MLQLLVYKVPQNPHHICAPEGRYWRTSVPRPHTFDPSKMYQIQHWSPDCKNPSKLSRKCSLRGTWLNSEELHKRRPVKPKLNECYLCTRYVMQSCAVQRIRWNACHTPHKSSQGAGDSWLVWRQNYGYLSSHRGLSLLLGRYSFPIPLLIWRMPLSPRRTISVAKWLLQWTRMADKPCGERPSQNPSRTASRWQPSVP